MASILISDAEKIFVLHGVRDDLRVDGRTRTDIRPMTVETDVVTHTAGSAHLRLANTDVLVGIKAELEDTTPECPEEGRLEFFVDCSANAAPEFEGRGGEDLGNRISRALAGAYGNSEVFDLKQLLVLKGRHCWTLYIDILILECGGNLFDAVSIAVKAALFNTQLPRVAVSSVADGGQPDLELSDDPYDGQQLEMEQAPVLVTLSRIGNHCVVDPTPEEEACSSASLVIGVLPDGRLSAIRKVGAGGFHLETMKEATKVGSQVGVAINSELARKLKEEDKRGRNGHDSQKVGFLG